MSNGSAIEFEVLLDEDVFLYEICPDADTTISGKKKLVSMVNDFEDGKWRYQKFQNFIWDNIAESALSASERQKLPNKPSTALQECAKKLRLSDDKGKGSEVAEIVLYGIMKHYFHALPVVPKIFYKQNPHDNAKGADSVHIVVQDEGVFTLWVGEAKFYKSVEQAVPMAIASVKESLQTEKLKKENSIITCVGDLDDLQEINESLKANIKKTLSSEVSIDEIKSILHIPILLLYECNFTKEATDFNEEYKEKIKASHKENAKKYFQKHQEEITDSTIHLCSKITFHLILFPVPDSGQIKDKFVEKAKYERGEVK